MSEFSPVAENPAWQKGPIVIPGTECGEPPPPPASSMMSLFGLKELQDHGHRVYMVPTSTSLAAIVHFFKVGSHGAHSYELDENETVNMVAATVTEVQNIAPCVVTFADAAGIKLRFSMQLSDSQVEKICALLPVDDCIRNGTENYAFGSHEDLGLEGTLKRDNLLHLWWD